uniref:Chymotrypsin inhibitor 1 n=1 Tax=Odontomachus monticola TaxID=613454 RepID=A0A348G6B0_ODOMO
MSRVTLVLLVAIAVLFSTVTSHPSTNCPENQEYTTCGSACPPSCISKPNQACTLQCVVGCQCKQGYLLKSSGICVSPDNC